MLVALMMVLVVAGSLLFHVLSPWRATPIASNWGFIDGTMALTFWITSAGFVGVILFMAYCLYRFRSEPGRLATYEPENRRLELLLGAVTSVAVVILLAPGLAVWGRFITPPEDAMELEAVGVQWNWSFRLPGKDRKFGASDVRFIEGANTLGVSPADPRGEDDLIVTTGEIHVPQGRPVKVLLRSIDVLHDFYVPEIRAKMDLVPGMETYFWFTGTKAGQYEILCVAYCGTGHPQMRGTLVVDTDADYEQWLDKQQTFAQTRRSEAARERRASSP
jgi:cytochrome c oxidase subunit 2